uniref:Uncharacterized protein n=1 Tax=Solanum lycopersicum TaxID=4081 RepID=A0A3Q7H121_SOLLC
MTVSGEVYMMILKTIATIPISIDLSLVPWRNVNVTKMRIAMKIASITKAIMIFCCRQERIKLIDREEEIRDETYPGDKKRKKDMTLPMIPTTVLVAATHPNSNNIYKMFQLILLL